MLTPEAIMGITAWAAVLQAGMPGDLTPVLHLGGLQLRRVCSLWCAQRRATAKSVSSTCGFQSVNSEQGLPLCLSIHVSQKKGDIQTCQACCALGRRES